MSLFLKHWCRPSHNSSGWIISHRVLEQCQRSGGRVELVTASINRVKSPSDYPDYQLTSSHEGSIPSTLVVHSANVSSLRHVLAESRRDPFAFKS